MKEKLNIKKILMGFIKMTSLALVVFHFMLTFLYVMPLTPIKLEHQLLLNSTIGAFFPQNWSLFAPNPISRNESLIVMCVGKDAPPISSVETLPSTQWEDITVPLWQGVQRNRFTAYDRLARTQGGAIRQFLGGIPELEHWRESCSKGSEEACKYFEDRMSSLKKNAEERLVKVASSYCTEAYGPGETNQVAIRIRGDVPVPWSKRYTETANTVHDTNVGIFPINDQVVTMGIYKSKRRMGL